jgi:hypothetical protein
MSEYEYNNKIINLVKEIRELKHTLGWSAKKGHLATAMWAVAVDVTTAGSLRWTRDDMANKVVYKQYKHIVFDVKLFDKCKDIHRQMDILFPNVPDRYSARLFVMQYLVDPNMDSRMLESNLFYIKETNEKLEKNAWVI